MSSINPNIGPSIDPNMYAPAEAEVEKTQQPGLSPIQIDRDTIIAATDSGTFTVKLQQQLHMAPVLFQTPAEVSAHNTGYVIKFDLGKPINVPSPSGHSDMLQAASQLAENGDIPYMSILKTIQDAIKDLEKALTEAQQNSNKIDKSKSVARALEFENKYEAANVNATAIKNIMIGKADASALEEIIANNPNVDNPSVPKENLLQGVIDKLMKDSKLNPKIADLLVVLAQLQYLQKNASNNASGGVIIGNNPEVMIALKKLGIKLPEPDPNVPFAGMAANLAAQNKPPYNDPAYKALANSMPKGWEVIMPQDFNQMILSIAKEIRKVAGDSYGIIAKPLQGLFGSALFSVNDERPKIEGVKSLIELKKILKEYISSCENKLNFDREAFVKKHDKLFQEAIKKGLINDFASLSYIKGHGTNHVGKDVYMELALKEVQDQINARGGEKIVVNRDPPPDTSGLGRLASGAVLGGMTGSIASMLDDLFENQLTNSFNDSTLPVSDKQNIQGLASMTIITTILGDALHSNPVLDGKKAHDRLEQSIDSLKESGAAQNIINSIFNGENGSTPLTEYQRDVLQEATKAFMINIGAISATTGNNGVQSEKAYAAMNAVKSNKSLAADVQGAQDFLNTKSSQLDDATRFQTLARQIAPSADHAVSSEENIDELREMIKLLKKILEEIVSGQSSQALGEAIKKIKEGMGTLQMQGFNTDIYG